MDLSPRPEAGFVPDQWGPGDVNITWVDVRTDAFTEPFASQTMRRLRDGGARIETTHWTALLESAPAVEVSGIIFHLARCGSTWLCQGLKALDRTLVISEPAALQAGWTFSGPAGVGSVPVLRHAMVQGPLDAFSRLGRLQGRDVFIKTASWQIESADLLLAGAPRARGVFLFRHPVEVVVSQLERIPSGLRTDERLLHHAVRLGLPESLVKTGTSEEILTQVTARLMSHALAHRDRLRFVGYESLLSNGLEPLLREFRPKLSQLERDRVRAASGRYAKDETGQRSFEPDGRAKRARASARLWQLYDEYLRVPYEACLSASGESAH